MSTQHRFRLFHVLEAVIAASDSLEQTWEEIFMTLALENMTKSTVGRPSPQCSRVGRQLPQTCWGCSASRPTKQFVPIPHFLPSSPMPLFCGIFEKGHCCLRPRGLSVEEAQVCSGVPLGCPPSGACLTVTYGFGPEPPAPPATPLQAAAQGAAPSWPTVSADDGSEGVGASGCYSHHQPVVTAGER